MTNAAGKYRQSNGYQSGWSRPHYVRNCASGANNTPLGTPHRMSPVDTSAVEPSSSSATATAKPEHEKSNKRNSEVVVEVCICVCQAAFTYLRSFRIIDRI
jgi:hypothetical protein